MEKIELLFESYNMAVEGAYNKFFMDRSAEDILKMVEQAASSYLQEAIADWEQTSLECIDSVTPQEYFMNITEFSDVLEHFKVGARMCDENLPNLLMDKLRNFGDKSIRALVDLATDRRIIESEDDFLVAITSIKLLGEFKAEVAVKPLMDQLLECGDDDELIMEEIGVAFVNIGAAAVQPIIESLNESQEIGLPQETLMAALSKIGQSSRTEEIYRCLKNTFLKMNNKVIGVILLGEYGDGRAIPALRGYMEKNRNSVDRETFYEIKSAIEKLGGNLDDI